MVFKIALGVFLGLAAWTYREDLGSVLLFFLFSAVIISLIVWFFKSLYEYYEKLKLTQSAKEIASEIVQLGLIEKELENALYFGLQIDIVYGGFYTLNSRLKQYKISLLNDDEDKYLKMEILKFANDAIEDFKIHRSTEKLS